MGENELTHNMLMHIFFISYSTGQRMESRVHWGAKKEADYFEGEKFWLRSLNLMDC